MCEVLVNNKKNSYVIGRIAVSKGWRGKNIGGKMIKAAEDSISRDGGNSVMVAAQVRVVPFYEKQGYKKEGETYLDEDCPHIWMKKALISK